MFPHIMYSSLAFSRLGHRTYLGGLLTCLIISVPAFSQTNSSPALSILKSGNQVELLWPASATGFVLERSATLTNPQWVSVPGVPDTPGQSGNQFSVQISLSQSAQFFRLRQGIFLNGIASASPMPEETGVAVTRETILRFSEALQTNTLLTVTQFHAEFGGRRMLSRVELSTDRKTATLFYQENLPASARIDVTFDSTGLMDVTGQPLDGDGDGAPGGIFTMGFTTLGNTPLDNTGVIGKVYASELVGGTNRPLKGVTVTVDGAEETLRAVTDATGAFSLNPSPSGRFFVHVDGRTADLSDWPKGAYYPFVGKAWEAIPGKTNNLASGTGEIFLPLIPADALTAVSAITNTTVTASASAIAANPLMAGVSISVPANSLYSDIGSRGGKVGIAPVPPDRLPEPLPPGLNFPIVITIQTDGPSNFDRPVPVRFPNLPDPVTGEKLPPGAKTMLWSFDHDTGRWEPQGTATISADGNFADTDPGVGVRQPGWHGVAPGTPGAGPEFKGPDGECLRKVVCTIPNEGGNVASCALKCLGNVPKEIFGGGTKTKRTPVETGLRCIGGPDICPANPEDTLTEDRRGCMNKCRFPSPDYVSYVIPCEGSTIPCTERQGLR
ncbi:MAG TPA: Ig-like domain-containing protein, partial [Verrucomicrobiae bacterium]|nr:Ig-like domain-containing protein [Verrucomicrobiae bacterium]